MNKNFEDKIFELISLKQEGEYWDFKRQWHENNADLLHDIICMANNLTDNDGYIIIGIDEKDDFTVHGVMSETNRKNTQKLVDFLKDKAFAGDRRPTVYVQAIEWAEQFIDVIVIQNNMYTPYYLTKDYENDKQGKNVVRAYHIYTRIMDTNTPKNRSADLDKVEYLWKKRFGINKTALERMQVYLEDKENWKQNEHGIKYYKYAPEFTIQSEYDRSRTGYEIYMLGQCDSTPYWEDIRLYYHSTLLTTASAVALDGGRCFTTAPKHGFVQIENKELFYYYFIENSLEYVLHEFFIHDNNGELSEEVWSRKKFFEVVLLFNSEDERVQFDEYVLNHCEKFEPYKEDAVPYIPDILGYDKETLKQQYYDAKVFKLLLEDFRNTY